MIDWKRKLTSRKFWLAVVAFITNILYSFNFSNITIEKITGIVMSGAVVIAYIIGEGLADASNHGQDQNDLPYSEDGDIEWR